MDTCLIYFCLLFYGSELRCVERPAKGVCVFMYICVIYLYLSYHFLFINEDVLKGNASAPAHGVGDGLASLDNALF